MKNIPEDLKNSKCCLKCKLVDVDYAAKKLTGTPRTLYKCKKCNSYVKSYNEINTSGRQFIFIILIICAVIHFGEGSESINIDHLFTADVIVFLLFGLVWFHNCSNKKKLEKFLQQHVERLERKAKEKGQ
jgi:hypothetical protein